MKKTTPTDNSSAMDALSDQYTELDLFIEDENHCCLCGGDLDFAHTFNYTEQSLVEKAQCTRCQIKTRETEHILH